MKTHITHPILSICIPTYNRPNELSRALQSLSKEFETLSPATRAAIEVIISDNCSTGADVRGLVQKYADDFNGPTLNIQQENIGPTKNFEFCYKFSTGKYVLILSDDDYLTKGALAAIMACLEELHPDIIFLPFFPVDLWNNSDGMFERNKFLTTINIYPTLVSSCILRRSLFAENLGSYLDTNMHHYHYFLRAAENGEHFYIFSRQMLECPYEHNSGGYNWFAVFGEQFFRIVDEFPARRIKRAGLDAIEAKLLIDRIIPTFVNRRIQGYTISQQFDDDSERKIFTTISQRCRRFWAYWLILLPLYLTPPRLLFAIKWVYQRQKSFFFRWH